MIVVVPDVAVAVLSACFYCPNVVPLASVLRPVVYSLEELVPWPVSEDSLNYLKCIACS